jgi:hypothetical protein
VKHFKNFQKINYASDRGILTPIENESLQFFKKPVRIVANLRDLRNRFTDAVALVNRDMLTRVWDEMDYRINLCRISKYGHIEHI